MSCNSIRQQSLSRVATGEATFSEFSPVLKTRCQLADEQDCKALTDTRDPNFRKSVCATIFEWLAGESGRSSTETHVYGLVARID